MKVGIFVSAFLFCLLLAGMTFQIRRLPRNLILIAGTSQPPITKGVGEILKLPVFPLQTVEFKNGEISTRLEVSVDPITLAFLFQSCKVNVNTCLMELILAVDILNRRSVENIIIVAPYLSYTRQDRPVPEDGSFAANVFAQLFEGVGATCIITMDIHSNRANNCYDNIVNLDPSPFFIDWIKSNIEGWQDKVVVVSPDAGGHKRAQKIAKGLNTSSALLQKHRPRPNAVFEMKIVYGDVKGNVCILVDDIVDTGHTLAKAAQTLEESGCLSVIALVTHDLLDNAGLDLVSKTNSLETIVVTNTLRGPGDPSISKLHVLDVSSAFSDAIRNNLCG